MMIASTDTISIKLKPLARCPRCSPLVPRLLISISVPAAPRSVKRKIVKLEIVKHIFV
jgi:hypothetical protein